jgi:hypothetical protein
MFLKYRGIAYYSGSRPEFIHCQKLSAIALMYRGRWYLCGRSVD